MIKFTNPQDWLTAALDAGFDVHSWGNGSGDAFESNDSLKGTWFVELDLPKGVKPYGVLESA